jgi:hypothetical protein
MSIPRALVAMQALAFDKSVGRRTVTLDGDTFDPSGTLTGGSKQQIGAMLGKLQVRFSSCALCVKDFGGVAASYPEHSLLLLSFPPCSRVSSLTRPLPEKALWPSSQHTVSPSSCQPTHGCHGLVCECGLRSCTW